jgi:monoterpene epsilon-lactone hydrolase
MSHGRGAGSASPAGAGGCILLAVDPPANVVPLQSPDGVEVRHLRAFVAVAEELNFSRAAERLYLSQPALSRQVRTLEQVMGCQLLRRSTHRVELTLAGEALLERARPVLAALDEAVAAARSVGGEMTARMMRLWAPVLAVANGEASFQAMRQVFESFLAQASSMPPDVRVRPVVAGGVPALGVGDDDPAILYLHGGGNVLGSAYGYRPLVAALVGEAGGGALVPDFRLAPEHPFPAAVDDAVSALAWLAGERGGASRVVLAGDSSGAVLALGVLLRLKAAGSEMPAGAALLCPLIEPAIGGEHLADPLTARILQAYLGGHRREDPLVNPLTADLAGLPPLLVQTATADRFRGDAEALAARARAHGVDVRLDLYPTDSHAFHIFWSFLPEAAEALRSAGGFVRDVLPGEAEPAARSAS